MLVKTEGWPFVLPNDDGIRPAGKPDECLYCKSKVGMLHGRECVCVSKVVEYDVFSDGVKVGTFTRDDPYFWDEHRCNFHKNESSWCTDNAVEFIKWFDTWFAKQVKLEVTSIAESEESCSCNHLVFRFVRVVDEGPFVELRDSEDTNVEQL